MIYVAEILDRKYVKIGYTNAEDVQSRISALQTGNPFEIKIVTVVDGTLRQEQSVHSSLRKAFARIRISMPPNEWYPGKHRFMRDFVENTKYGINYAIMFADQYNESVKQAGHGLSGLEPNIRWATGKVPDPPVIR